MAKNKNIYVKLTLDLILMVLLVLLCKKNSINLMFHEVVGLGIVGLMVIHILLNWKWVISIKKCLFGKKVNAKTRFMHVLNFMLFFFFIMSGVTGIFISKVLFSFNFPFIWRSIHFFSAAMSILLTGIHLGMHLKMIKNVLHIKMPNIGVIILSVVIIIGGTYSFSKSEMMHWLTAPFSTQRMGEGKNGNRFGPGMHFKEGLSDDSGYKAFEENGQGNGQGRGSGQGRGNGQGQGNGQGRGSGQGRGRGQGQGNGQGRGSDQGRGMNHDMSGAGGFSIKTLLQLIATYGSILLAISFITNSLYEFMKYLKNKRNKNTEFLNE